MSPCVSAFATSSYRRFRASRLNMRARPAPTCGTDRCPDADSFDAASSVGRFFLTLGNAVCKRTDSIESYVNPAGAPRRVFHLARRWERQQLSCPSIPVTGSLHLGRSQKPQCDQWHSLLFPVICGARGEFFNKFQRVSKISLYFPCSLQGDAGSVMG